jgi:hypothetical protein
VKKAQKPLPMSCLTAHIPQTYGIKLPPLYLYKNAKIDIMLYKPTVILGLMSKSPKLKQINAIIIITKAYLFQCFKNNTKPQITVLKNIIYYKFMDEKFICELNGNSCSVWNAWSFFFI